ncbi:MAG: hypothetical protein Q8R00_01845 [Candidatus Nanoarchaeia archaeon]|nr:hypothetical protein [Candidatus Nanoarchaeia archaeon]
MKRAFLTLLIILLSLQIVSAAEQKDQFSIEIEKVTDQIPAGGEAKFLIRVTNNANRQDIVQLTPGSLDIFPFSKFARAILIEPAIISLGYKETAEAEVSIRSLDDAESNKNHASTIEIKSLTSEYKSSATLNTFVISDKDLIQIVLKTPKLIIPGKLNTLEVILKNRGDVEFENLEFYLTSEVWKENEIISFEPNEEIKRYYEINLPPGTKSGEYNLVGRLYNAEELKGEGKVNFRVGRNADLKEKEDVEKGFLAEKIIIINLNEGNAPVESSFDYQAGFFTRLFTSVSPDAEVISGSYVWNFAVEPADDYIIEIDTDYKPGLLILIVLGSLFGLVVYVLSRGVRVKKRLFKIRSTGDEKEVKVMLHIKNRDNKEVHNVKVVDLLPSVVKPTGHYSTLVPDKIEQGIRGMRMIWTLETLAPGEERVLSYNAISDVAFVGDLRIPPASVQYFNRKAKFVLNKSNSVSLR